MKIKYSKTLDLIAIYSFIVMIYSGLIKWFDFWPIDPIIIFGLITILCLIIKALSKMKISLIRGYTNSMLLIFPFSIWLYISITYSFSDNYVYTKALNYILIVFSFLFPFFYINDLKSLKRFLLSFSTLGVLVSFVFLYLYIIGGNDLYLTYFKLTENDLNPLGIPDYLALAGPVGISAIILIFQKQWSYRVLSLLCVFTLIILSGRAPILSLIIILIIYALVNAKLSIRFFRNFTIILISILFSSSYFLNLKPFERINERISVMFSGNTSDNASVIVRFEMLDLSKDIFFKSPLIGIGLGSFGIFMQGKDVRDHPHNMIVEILIEQGIIGFLLFSILFAPLIFKIIPYLITKNNYIFFICGGIFIYEFLNVMKSSSIVENRPFFTIVAICFIASKLKVTNDKNNLN